jgi:AcrR family transcriptional regulator
MREWVPVPSSARGRLAAHALAAFGEHGYEGVAVGALARAAGVTTGSLYHHFGSKLGLYAVVREEVERRVLDRMEGASGRGRGQPRRVPRRPPCWSASTT